MNRCVLIVPKKDFWPQLKNAPAHVAYVILNIDFAGRQSHLLNTETRVERGSHGEGAKSNIMSHSDDDDASHGRDPFLRAQRTPAHPAQGPSAPLRTQEYLRFVPSKLEQKPYGPPPDTAASGTEYYVNVARCLRAQRAAASCDPAASTEHLFPAQHESRPPSPPTPPSQTVQEPELMIDKLTVAERATCLKARQRKVGYRVHSSGVSLSPRACLQSGALTGTVSSAMVV